VKKLLLFFCLSFLSGKVFCQNYKPFPDSNAYWVEGHGWLYYQVPCSYWHDWSKLFYLGSDTIINSSSYHKLYFRGTYSYHMITQPGCLDGTVHYTYMSESLFACVRQDTGLKKVFLYDFSNNNDTLLYDFNLTVGDTLPQTYINVAYPNVVVQAIDSIQLTDGFHKRFVLNTVSVNGPAAIIEGIGSTYGLLTPLLGQLEGYDQLVCFSHDSVIYPDTSVSCDLTVAIPEQNPEQLFSLSPNPFQNFINIKNNQQKDLSITIFSPIGEVVHKTTLLKDASVTINLSGLAAGIYLVTARSDNNFTARKIIKE